MDVKPGSTPAEGSCIVPGALQKLNISVDNSQESCTGMKRGTQEPSCSGNNVETEKMTATGNKSVNVEKVEPTQMATPGTSRTAREDPSTGEKVSSHHSNEKLMEYVCVFQRDL